MGTYLHQLRDRRRKRLAHSYTQPTDTRIAVIGMGRFGYSLASELMRRGWDVLGVDTNARRVQKFSEEFSHVVEADCSDEQVLEQLGLREFTHVVVGIGSDVEASILITSNLLDAGVPNIWAKAVSRQHAKILERLGAHHVVLPEHEMGERVAHLVTGRMLDFIQLDEDYALVKTLAPESITGVPLGRSEPRSNWGITVVGLKRPGQGFTHATADTVVEIGDIIVVTGPTTAVVKFADLK